VFLSANTAQIYTIFFILQIIFLFFFENSLKEDGQEELRCWHFLALICVGQKNKMCLQMRGQSWHKLSSMVGRFIVVALPL
jgi:membrane-bound acyltransferase YfiQ involved in biofilm formation